MATLRLDQLAAYDAALDGVGLYLEPTAEAPHAFEGTDNAVPRQNIGDNLDENKLDERWWGSNRSWHEGAGQKRLQVPRVSSAFGFLSSKGIDISEPGEARLHHETSKVYANTYSTKLQRAMVANDALWTPRAAAGVRKITDVTGTGSDVSAGGTQHIEDMTSDGSTLYLAMGTDGVRQIRPADASGQALSVPAGNFTVVEWAKDRLFAIGPTGTPVRQQLVEFSVAGVATQRHLFAENHTPVQMCELGPLLYIAVNTASQGFIFAYDGRTVPFVALPLPPGDLIVSMTPFLGAGMLVGARRKREGLAEMGVVYVVLPEGAGHLVAWQREILFLGEDDTTTTRSYRIERGVNWHRSVYFAWPYDDASGLGFYNPQNAAYSRHLYGATVGQIGGVTVWRGRLVFTIQADGLYIEKLTNVASGYIISSYIDNNLDALQTWGIQESAFEPLPVGTKIGHELSVDAGVTFTGSTEAASTGVAILRTQRGVAARRIQYKTTLSANTAKTLTPVLTKSGIGSAPAAAAGDVHALAIRAFPDARSRTGEQQHSTLAGSDLFETLQVKRKAGGTYEYQPPGWQGAEDTLKVRITGLRKAGPWGINAPKQGGYLVMTLREDV